MPMPASAPVLSEEFKTFGMLVNEVEEPEDANGVDDVAVEAVELRDVG